MVNFKRRREKTVSKKHLLCITDIFFRPVTAKRHHNDYPTLLVKAFPYGFRFRITDQKSYSKRRESEHIVYRLIVGLGIREHADS